MNWLAHLHLAPEESAWRIGCLLPDLVDARTLKDLPDVFLPGIREHHRIDAFTDRHPLFRRSRARIAPPYRRFSGMPRGTLTVMVPEMRLGLRIALSQKDTG